MNNIISNIKAREKFTKILEELSKMVKLTNYLHLLEKS